MNCSIFITTHGNSTLSQQAKNCLPGFNLIIFKGDEYPSYSKLVNDCILTAKEEIVIIMNHKVRPVPLQVYKMINLLYKGFGLVCLRNFHFYGFKKDLIREIGFFDERFVGGGFEDKDFGNRLLENDIALYESAESQEIYMDTSWKNQTKAVEFFSKKWKETRTSWKRLLPDEKYDYDLGPIVNEKNNWLSFKESLLLSSLESHQRLKYFNDKPIDLTNLKSSK